MKYEQFKNIIEKLEKVRDRSHDLYALGINLMDHEEIYHEIITTLFLSVFDKEGKDWIDWYLYERIGFTDKVNLATDIDGNSICYDIPSLWEEVKHNLISNKDEI